MATGDLYIYIRCGTWSFRRFLFGIERCGDTPRWVLCVTALSRVNNEGTPQSALEEPAWS